MVRWTTALGPEVRQHEMGKTWQRRPVLFREAMKKNSSKKGWRDSILILVLW